MLWFQFYQAVADATTIKRCAGCQIIFEANRRDQGSIRERSKGWREIRVELGQGPDGKLKREIIQFRGNKTEANKKLRELLTSLDKGIPVSTQKITLGQWLSKWMTEYIVPNKRQKTIDRYEGLIRKHIIPDLGSLELTKLTPSEIRTLEAKLTAEGMDPKGVELVHTVISGAYKFALQEDTVCRNPAKAVTPPKVERREVEPPEIARVKEVLQLAEEEGHPLYPCLFLMAHTGLRREEALGLRHQDLNLGTGLISIGQTVGRSLYKGVIIEPTKTTYSRRNVDLGDDTVAVLGAHIGKQLLNRMELEEAYKDHGLVFPDPLGKPLNPMALTREFQSFAKRLGHASIAATRDIYGYLLPGWQKEAPNTFAKAMREG